MPSSVRTLRRAQSDNAGRVEILPIKIKMDFKPKRVDYQAIRAGKLVELMNFFHFDGAEMTLRRVVITGVRSALYALL